MWNLFYELEYYILSKMLTEVIRMARKAVIRHTENMDKQERLGETKQ